MRNGLSQLQRWVVVAAASAGVLFSLPAFAQSAPSSEGESRPEAAEGAESSDGAVTGAEFTVEELEQFANVIPDLQTIQTAAQANVVTVVEDSGLTAERFNEIAEAQASGESAEAVNVSSEEQAAFEVVTGEIEQIESDFLSQREELLEAEGLTVERYQELLAAVQSDPNLLQQIEALL